MTTRIVLLWSSYRDLTMKCSWLSWPFGTCRATCSRAMLEEINRCRFLVFMHRVSIRLYG